MRSIDRLKTAFSGTFPLKEKRPDTFQVLAPFFHEDGDMLEIFVEPVSQNRYRLCDHGLTLMRLSYDINLTENKEALYTRILAENGLDEQDGNIFIDSDYEDLLPRFFHFSQTLGKVSSLRYMRKKTIQNLFYDTLMDYADQAFFDLPHQTRYAPIASHTDCLVDVMFAFAKRPLFLFGIRENDNAKALEVAANCFEFKTEGLHFQSLLVYENYDSITQKNNKRLLRATDKTFVDFEQFRHEGRHYIEHVA